MKKYSSLLLAAALILGVAAFTPVPAKAIDWCLACDNNQGCFECCKCDGGTTGECGWECGSPDDTAFGTQAAWMSDDEGQVPVCTADQAVSTDCTAVEAPSTDEAPSATEAP